VYLAALAVEEAEYALCCQSNQALEKTADAVLAPLVSFIPSLGVDVNALHAANTKKYLGT